MTRFYIRTARSDARYQEAVARERQQLRDQQNAEPGPLWRALSRWASKGSAVAITEQRGYGRTVRIGDAELAFLTAQLEAELLEARACRFLVAREIPEGHPERQGAGVECDVAAEFETPTGEIPKGHCCARRTLDGAWIEMSGEEIESRPDE